jgi:hypothetical protein
MNKKYLYVAGADFGLCIKKYRPVAMTPAVIEETLEKAREEMEKLHSSFGRIIYKVDATEIIKGKLDFGMTRGFRDGYLILEKFKQ